MHECLLSSLPNLHVVKYQTVICILFLAIIQIPIVETAATNCPDVAGSEWYYRAETDVCYYQFPGQYTFPVGRSLCLDHGLILVELPTAAEQQWLVSKIAIQHWLGLKKSAGVWRWTSTQQIFPTSDSRWVPGTTSGNRGFKQTNLKIASTESTSSYAVVCQTTPVTATSTVPSTPSTAVVTTLTTGADNKKTTGSNCSGFEKFRIERKTEGFSKPYKTLQEHVETLVECGIKCIIDDQCFALQYYLGNTTCIFLERSSEYMTCDTNSDCYYIHRIE